MKNRDIVYARHQARIYQNYYKPSLNIFRFLGSILTAFISGSAPGAHHVRRRK